MFIRRPELPQNGDKLPKFVVFWTISTIQDEKSAAKFHYTTSGYATWFTAGGAIRIAHYDVINRKLRDTEKRRPPRPMKSSDLSNGENRIPLRQVLQNRKLRHL